MRLSQSLPVCSACSVSMPTTLMPFSKYSCLFLTAGTHWPKSSPPFPRLPPCCCSSATNRYNNLCWCWECLAFSMTETTQKGKWKLASERRSEKQANKPGRKECEHTMHVAEYWVGKKKWCFSHFHFRNICNTRVDISADWHRTSTQISLFLSYFYRLCSETWYTDKNSFHEQNSECS